MSVKGKSKTLKNALIDLSLIILGLILIIIVHYVDIYNMTPSLLVGYFTPVMETIDRYGILFIIGGTILLINVNNLLTNFFFMNEKESDVDVD